MKKTWAVLLVALGLVAGIAAGRLLFAEEQDPNDGMQDMGMMNQQQQGQGGPGMMMDQGQGRGMKGKGMMMEHMMGGKSSMVATPDGGVIVLEGHRLVKYDSQLTLVKEVELPKGPDHKKKNPQTDANAEEPAAQASPIAQAGEAAPE